MTRKRYDGKGREMFTIADEIMRGGASSRPATEADLESARRHADAASIEDEEE